MVEIQDFVEILLQCGATFFSGVPDSLLAGLSAELDRRCPSSHAIACNEGSAVALAIGAYAATKRVPIVYMQNSGLGNAHNPLVSLANRVIYGTPMLIIVGWRAEILADGMQLADEPQHRIQGRTTLGQLDLLDIPYRVTHGSPTDLENDVRELMALAVTDRTPVALVFRKGALRGQFQRDATAAVELPSRETGEKQLCMAGGVALNCVANGKLLGAGIFDDIWVQPAAGDSGGALGAALAGWYAGKHNVRRTSAGDTMKATLLGSSYSNAEIETVLKANNAVYARLDDSELCGAVADLLADGNVVGWFQGRMEFGPRALGSRSILGDPRNPTMQSMMNLKIKNRESFRPFAPAVLEEHAAHWFKLDRPSPYMLFVVDIQDGQREPVLDGEQQLSGIERLKCVRSSVPAVTHVDYSARVQTVGKASNTRFRELLERFHEKTGCPILVNTSFNVRGEPIVESPHNAFLCFMRTQMDYLVLGNCVLRKIDQPPLIEAADWREQFALD